MHICHGSFGVNRNEKKSQVTPRLLQVTRSKKKIVVQKRKRKEKKNQIQSYHSHQRGNNNQISIETVTMKIAARLLKYVQSIKFVGGPHPAPSMLHKHFLPIVVQY